MFPSFFEFYLCAATDYDQSNVVVEQFHFMIIFRLSIDIFVKYFVCLFFKILYFYLQSDFKIVIEGTRASNSLPSGVNWNFYNSYPKFKKVVSSRQNHVLKL